ncbi:hypothetical protein MASR2M17_02240 [Aminivibrio sp.]
MSKVKIVCTLGPACSDHETMTAMVRAGMNVARFNFSHGDYDGHLAMLELVRTIEKEEGTYSDPPTPRPEIRTGKVEGARQTRAGQLIASPPIKRTPAQPPGSTSITGPCPGVASCRDLHRRRQPPACRGVRLGHGRPLQGHRGGLLSDTKGRNIPGADISLPALAEKDLQDIQWGIDHSMDYIAVSFVKSRSDIMEVRRVMEAAGGSMKVVAKIETRQSILNIESIADVVDGMMIARGDLGVEIPTEDVPLQQKRIIDICRSRGKAVIVATQMLDSMIRNPRPTRAEASDVANAVLDGTDAVMLSGETAKGLTLPVGGDQRSGS